MKRLTLETRIERKMEVINELKGRVAEAYKRTAELEQKVSEAEKEMEDLQKEKAQQELLEFIQASQENPIELLNRLKANDKKK